mmetsp:Transcript_6540/g.18410  ORF Transcript_6540/g.18410 Transcript_6540/m.18410 type:complete len:777 (+) Transcript_6540:89-2419(+)
MVGGDVAVDLYREIGKVRIKLASLASADEGGVDVGLAEVARLEDLNNRLTLLLAEGGEVQPGAVSSGATPQRGANRTPPSMGPGPPAPPAAEVAGEELLSQSRSGAEVSVLADGHSVRRAVLGLEEDSPSRTPRVPLSFGSVALGTSSGTSSPRAAAHDSDASLAEGGHRSPGSAAGRVQPSASPRGPAASPRSQLSLRKANGRGTSSAPPSASTTAASRGQKAAAAPLTDGGGHRPRPKSRADAARLGKPALPVFAAARSGTAAAVVADDGPPVAEACQPADIDEPEADRPRSPRSIRRGSSPYVTASRFVPGGPCDGAKVAGRGQCLSFGPRGAPGGRAAGGSTSAPSIVGGLRRAPEGGEVAGPIRHFLVDDSRLPHDCNTPGLEFRRTRVLEDLAGEEHFASWGSVIAAVELGDGWVRVAGRGYLPMVWNGLPLLSPQDLFGSGSGSTSGWWNCIGTGEEGGAAVALVPPAQEPAETESVFDAVMEASGTFSDLIAGSSVGPSEAETRVAWPEEQAQRPTPKSASARRGQRPTGGTGGGSEAAGERDSGGGGSSSSSAAPGGDSSRRFWSPPAPPAQQPEPPPQQRQPQPSAPKQPRQPQQPHAQPLQAQQPQPRQEQPLPQTQQLHQEVEQLGEQKSQQSLPSERGQLRKPRAKASSFDEAPKAEWDSRHAVATSLDQQERERRMQERLLQRQEQQAVRRQSVAGSSHNDDILGRPRRDEERDSVSSSASAAKQVRRGVGPASPRQVASSAVALGGGKERVGRMAAQRAVT